MNSDYNKLEVGDTVKAAFTNRYGTIIAIDKLSKVGETLFEVQWEIINMKSFATREALLLVQKNILKPVWN